MKKQLRKGLTSLIYFSLISYANAQITITRSDFANVGDYSVGAYDTIFAGITPGNAGANQTWDFSTLQNHYMDTTYFMAPAATPYASNFPSANIAAYNSLDSSYAFINANTSILNIVGYVAPNPFTGIPTALSFSPPVTQITFPSNLSTSFNVTNATAQTTFYYSGTYMSISYDSIRATTIIDRSSIIDGWGTVKTPQGDFSALRQKLTEITDISIEAHITFGWIPVPIGQTDTVIHYYYLGNGQDWPLAEIQTNPSDTVTGAQYLLNAVNAVPEISASGNDIIVYPNPLADEFSITVLNNKAVMLKVFDVHGKETGKFAVDNSGKSFSMTSVSAGIYMYQVLDKAGAIISTGKLAVQK